MTRPLSLFVLTVFVAACASAPKELAVKPIRGLPPLLTWVAEYTRPFGARYPDLPDSSKYGSLSGLAKDPNSDQWVGVIDERADSRVAWLSFSYAAGAMNVTPSRLTALRPAPGIEDRLVTQADLEAVTALPDGTFLASEEGHAARGQLFQPAMLHFTRDGLVTEIISYPDEFTLRADQLKGLRSNQGFESLTRLPNGHLIAGLEQPLIQDGAMPSFEHGARGRLIEFAPNRGGSGFHAVKQWWYPINKTPTVAGFDEVCTDGENGLVELLALSDTKLLAMERACLTDRPSGGVFNPIQIFAVELTRREAHKSLVLNLSTLKPKLSPALDRLENFEGMTFGPTASNGLKTILLVSDDNFRATQKTSFLLFGIRY